jgi:hypothetical protein
MNHSENYEHPQVVTRVLPLWLTRSITLSMRY